MPYLSVCFALAGSFAFLSASELVSLVAGFGEEEMAVRLRDSIRGSRAAVGVRRVVPTATRWGE